MDRERAGRLLIDYQFLAALLAAPLACWFMVRLGILALDLSFTHPHSMRRLFLLALVYPVLEEIVFRQGIQGGLHRTGLGGRAWRGISMANLFTSLIFSLFHLFNQSVGWAAAVFLPSTVFGFFRDKYNAILPCIILHVWYNACFFLFFHLA